MKISNSVRCKSVFPENFPDNFSLTKHQNEAKFAQQIIVKFCLLFCYFIITEIEGNECPAGKIKDNFGQVTSKSFHFNKNQNSTFQIWPKIEEKMKSIFEEMREEELENLQEEIIAELSANTEAKNRTKNPGIQ